MDTNTHEVAQKVKNGEKKTVFITITRSFLTRNFLRSGTLEQLKRSGFRVVIFFPTDRIPGYLRTEFEDSQVILHGFPIRIGPFHRRVNVIKRYLIDTDITRLVIRHYTKTKKRLPNGLVVSVRKSKLFVTLQLLFLKTLSRLPPARHLFRWIEFKVFPEKNAQVQEHFDRYQPDVVFAASLMSSFDILFLKEAKRRKVPTVAMPKGWDNLTKEYYPFAPDHFAVHNQISASVAKSVQDFVPEHIHVVGQPQFDWYARSEIFRTRSDHFLRKGLDPDRALIFFGSEGAWSVNDYHLVEHLLRWIEHGELAKPSQVLLRPHYSNVREDVFKDFRKKTHVVVDDYRTVDFLIDKWDPSVEETVDFTNSVIHCDVMINVASTLALDAACVDRPVVMVGFGCEYEGERDVTIPRLYGSDHMRWLLATEGTDRADSLEALKEAINHALVDPQKRARGRERIRKELCYKVDGRSSERLACLLEKVML